MYDPENFEFKFSRVRRHLKPWLGVFIASCKAHMMTQFGGCYCAACISIHLGVKILISKDVDSLTPVLTCLSTESVV